MEKCAVCEEIVEFELKYDGFYYCPNCGCERESALESLNTKNHSTLKKGKFAFKKNQPILSLENPKIRGYLLIVAISTFLSPFILLSSIFETYELYDPETWSKLIYNNQTWALLINFEMVSQILMFIFSIILAVSFFRKKSYVPRIFIGLYIAQLLTAIAEYVIAIQIPIIASYGYSNDYTSQLIRSIIGCAIFIPYFFKSRRVKETFIY